MQTTLEAPRFTTPSPFSVYDTETLRALLHGYAPVTLESRKAITRELLRRHLLPARTFATAPNVEVTR